MDMLLLGFLNGGNSPITWYTNRLARTTSWPDNINKDHIAT